MKRLLRFLKLAECLDRNNDMVGLQTLCIQFSSFIKKHGHLVPDNDGKTPNPWRRNMDYADWENSPYFGSVSEFMEKFPNGIKDWVKWRRETQEERNEKWNIKKASEIESLREELSELEHEQWVKWAKDIMKEEDISKERKDRWKECLCPYKKLSEKMKEFDREWADKVIEVIKKHDLEVKAHFVDTKKDHTEKFPKEPHLWSGDGPSSFKSILEFMQKYRSQDTKDTNTSAKAVIDFINYWKLLKKKNKKKGR